MFGYTLCPMPQPSKKQQIVFAAKSVFLDKGFHSTTMDDIALAANTTKRTVYNHFQNKEQLFREVIGFAVELFMGRLPDLDAKDPDIEGVITRYMARFVESCTWRDAVRMQWTLLSVRDLFPDLCVELFYTIDTRTGTQLSDYLKVQMESGRIMDSDPAMFARQLFGMCTAAPQFRTLFHLAEPLSTPPADEISPEIDQDAIRSGVQLFLSAVATDDSAESAVSSV